LIDCALFSMPPQGGFFAEAGSFARYSQQVKKA
jgi:hypothetical protein